MANWLKTKYEHGQNMSCLPLHDTVISRCNIIGHWLQEDISVPTTGWHQLNLFQYWTKNIKLNYCEEEAEHEASVTVLSHILTCDWLLHATPA